MASACGIVQRSPPERIAQAAAVGEGTAQPGSGQRLGAIHSRFRGLELITQPAITCLDSCGVDSHHQRPSDAQGAARGHGVRE